MKTPSSGLTFDVKAVCILICCWKFYHFLSCLHICLWFSGTSNRSNQNV